MPFAGTTALTELWAKAKAKFIHTKSMNGYNGLVHPDDTDQEWMRTTGAGLIPYKGGGTSSALGTTQWPFSNVVTNKLHAATSVGPTYDTTTRTVIPVNAAAYLQSPVSPFLWHDLFAFNYVTTPTFATTTNGSSWVTADVDKRFFNQMENQAIPVLTASIVGARWTWNSTSFNYSTGGWLILGITYTYPQCKYDVLFEQSADGETWTAIHSSENLSYNQQPIWCRAANSGANPYLRLTIRKHDIADEGTLSLACIRYLSSRWGNQGQGSEISKPYCWDADRNIFPWVNNTASLGTSAKRWSNAYATTFHGALDGKATTAGTADSANSVAWSNVSGKPTNLSQFTDNLGSSPTHTHSQYLTSTAASTTYQPKGDYALQSALNSAIDHIVTFDTTYTFANDVYTFTVHVYRNGTEITNNIPASKFSWKMNDSSGNAVKTATGVKTFTVSKSEIHYVGNVVAEYEE